MDQWSRRIIGFGIHKGDVDDITACRMFNHAISGADPPGNLSTDNDPLFKSHRSQANLRISEVNEIKSMNRPGFTGDSLVPFQPFPLPVTKSLLAS